MFGLCLAMPTKYGSKFRTEHMLKSSAGIWNNGLKKKNLFFSCGSFLVSRVKGWIFLTLILSDLNQ